MRKILTVVTLGCLLGAAGAAAAESVNIDEAENAKQWGLEAPPGGGTSMTEDPAKYAAAQQVDQSEVSSHWARKLLILLVVAGGGGLALWKLRGRAAR